MGLEIEPPPRGPERLAVGSAAVARGLPGSQPAMLRAGGLPASWQRLPDRLVSKQAMVDLFTRPALLVDGRLSLIAVNRAAERLLTAGRWLMDRQGVLRCAEHGSDQRLGTMIAELALSAVAREPARGSRWFRLDDPEGGDVMPATLSLLSRDSRRQADALVLVTLHDPDYGVHVDAGMLEALFSMTPAEARVACALVRGLSPKQTAEHCGVALGTVRTQLKAVFAKTRTRRQAELVRLLIGLSPA